MAKYISQYLELGFFVKGEFKRFSCGQYNTTDKAEIAVLDGLIDAVKEAEQKAPTPKKSPAKAKSTAKEA